MPASPASVPAATPGDAAPAWPWRTSADPLTRFPADFLSRDAEAVAPDLLGHRVVSEVGGRRTEGVIVEVEAYVGPHDPASHAAERIGRTNRNDVMFRDAGVAYVYFIYGMHWCLNVVTGVRDHPSAVLIRALDPLVGRDVMADRRGRTPLASGPGRLCQALGVTGALNGHDLGEAPLRLLPGWTVEPGRIVAT
ncbi:MAG: DNA-3-methyladenine glycosylase, partial [Actinobacteria bacterium]|nr:DNA-3-methyladenine glycosylase [Actinomycetota bacterium]NIX22229.1 DNA-3-methyladenine glycosylase [Actinomycetota bacterium]